MRRRHNNKRSNSKKFDTNTTTAVHNNDKDKDQDQDKDDKNHKSLTSKSKNGNKSNNKSKNSGKRISSARRGADITPSASESASNSAQSLPSFCNRWIVGGVLVVMSLLIVIVVALLASSGECADVDKVGGDCAKQARRGTLVATDDEPPTSSPTRPQVDISKIYVGDHYEVLGEYDHDTNAFTQGLTYHNGKLYESVGLYGESDIREVDPTDATQILRSERLANEFFAEGLAFYPDGSTGEGRLIQITWREQQGFIYAAEPDGTDKFPLVRQFTYDTFTSQGWGITYWAERQEFVVSDGSEYLHFWDRDTLQEKRRVAVQIPVNNANTGMTDMNPLRRLNELEWFHHADAKQDVGPWILANVWFQDTLVAIDPDSGMVMRVYDFDKLYRPRDSGSDVFNGISRTDDPRVFFVTGKLWPKMYKVRLLDEQ